MPQSPESTTLVVQVGLAGHNWLPLNPKLIGGKRATQDGGFEATSWVGRTQISYKHIFSAGFVRIVDLIGINSVPFVGNTQ